MQTALAAVAGLRTTTGPGRKLPCAAGGPAVARRTFRRPNRSIRRFVCPTCRRVCRPTCCSAVRTFSKPNINSRPPMPTSAPPGPPFSRPSPLPARPAPPARQLESLFAPGSQRMEFFTANHSWPIFAAGRTSPNLQAAKVRQTDRSRQLRKSHSNRFPGSCRLSRGAGHGGNATGGQPNPGQSRTAEL